MKRVSITTIARELGVSTTTVHRALNGDARISDFTRQRVLEVAHQLGYRPNQNARGLRLSRTHTIGAIVTGISSTFYARILDGIENAARKSGYGVLLGCSHDSPQKEQEQIELLLERQVDGLIIAPADPAASIQHYLQLVHEGVPLVFVGRHVPGVPVQSVETNNVSGGYLVGQHLCNIGRRNIAIVTTIASKRQYSYVHERIHGCLEAVQQFGNATAQVIGEDILETMPLPDFAYRAVSQHIQKGGMLDAIFAINDDLAYGAIGALLDLGLHVPEEVSVVGFNDEAMSAYFRPPLTTVRTAVCQIGSEAVRLLVEAIEGAQQPVAARRILLMPELVVRGSCGARLPIAVQDNSNQPKPKEGDPL
ncbi:MAG: LacI family DNA-binding transcriptional regulator [Chthonomonadetes bacterium]|nr:LacI family DNA-binding transcriptional regulator [Chthonomonadetes bacterium]